LHTHLSDVQGFPPVASITSPPCCQSVAARTLRLPLPVSAGGPAPRLDWSAAPPAPTAAAATTHGAPG